MENAAEAADDDERDSEADHVDEKSFGVFLQDLMSRLRMHADETLAAPPVRLDLKDLSVQTWLAESSG